MFLYSYSNLNNSVTYFHWKILALAGFEPRTSRYQADMLPIELSWLGSFFNLCFIWGPVYLKHFVCSCDSHICPFDVFSKLINASQFTSQVNEDFNNPLNALSVHKFQRVLITPGKQFMFAGEQFMKEVSISACRARGFQLKSCNLGSQIFCNILSRQPCLIRRVTRAQSYRQESGCVNYNHPKGIINTNMK